MMTTVQKRKVLQRMSDVESDIATLKKVRVEVATSGYASATMSSGGGAKSYTHIDLTKIAETIASLSRELVALKKMLASDGGGEIPSKKIYTVYW